jgi:hypothetical protein
VIPFALKVPSLFMILTSIESPADCPNTAAGTATVADPLDTVTPVTSATVEPPSRKRTVIVPVKF